MRFAPSFFLSLPESCHPCQPWTFQQRNHSHVLCFSASGLLLLFISYVDSFYVPGSCSPLPSVALVLQSSICTIWDTISIFLHRVATKWLDRSEIRTLESCLAVIFDLGLVWVCNIRHFLDEPIHMIDARISSEVILNLLSITPRSRTGSYTNNP